MSSEYRIRKQNHLIDRFVTPAILSFFQSVQFTIRFSRQGTMRWHYFFFSSRSNNIIFFFLNEGKWHHRW